MSISLVLYFSDPSERPYQNSATSYHTQQQPSSYNKSKTFFLYNVINCFFYIWIFFFRTYILFIFFFFVHIYIEKTHIIIRIYKETLFKPNCNTTTIYSPCLSVNKFTAGSAIPEEIASKKMLYPKIGFVSRFHSVLPIHIVSSGQTSLIGNYKPLYRTAFNEVTCVAFYIILGWSFGFYLMLYRKKRI